jgi:HSP20 family molecular chaperone IbpA
MLKNDMYLFDPYRILEDLYRPSGRFEQASSFRTETDANGASISVDLPGVKSKDVSLTVTGRIVKISGKLRNEEFERTYRLSRDYDPDSADASLEDGVLTIKFRKSSTSETKSIEIKTK